MRIRTLSLSVWLLLLLGLTANAQTNPKRDNLRGFQFTEVIIKVARSRSAGAEVGLSERQLQVDVELRLRKAGLHVKDVNDPITIEDLRAYEITPSLDVLVTIVGSDDLKGVFAADVNVRLKRMGKFGKDYSQAIFAAVWTDGITSILGKDMVEPGIRRQIADLIDRFINDYLAANPKAVG